VLQSKNHATIPTAGRHGPDLSFTIVHQHGAVMQAFMLPCSIAALVGSCPENRQHHTVVA
jgi:hypothetical protein